MEHKIETIVGFIVIVIAIGFLIFTYKVADVKTMEKTYVLNAKFDQVEGIIVGSDVRASGIKIGSVVKLKLDLYSYKAIMTIGINRHIKLPDDSSLKIVSAGLLGSKYVLAEVGAGENMLKPGEEIKYTQSSVNLETLISKAIFSMKGKEKEQKE